MKNLQNATQANHVLHVDPNQHLPGINRPEDQQQVDSESNQKKESDLSQQSNQDTGKQVDGLNIKNGDGDQHMVMQQNVAVDHKEVEEKRHPKDVRPVVTAPSSVHGDVNANQFAEKNNEKPIYEKVSDI